MSFYTFCDCIGSKIYHRWVDDQGKSHQEVISQYPIELFMRGDGDFKSLYGERLQVVRNDDISAAKKFVEEYSDLKIYGQTSVAHQFIAKEYPGEIKIDLDKVSILNFDIETRFDGYDPWDEITVRLPSGEETASTVGEIESLPRGSQVWDKYNETWYDITSQMPHKRPGGFPDPEKAEYEITSISCKTFGRRKKITFGLKDFTGEFDQDRVYIKCSNEVELLKEFLNYVRALNPHFLTGWNIDSFDIPYIVNRLKTIAPGMEALLSPFHTQTSTKNCIKPYFIKDTETNGYRILGLPSLDYMLLYQRFGKKQEQYSLDFISEVELEEKKLDYSDYDDNLMVLYLKNFNRYIEYNERDVYLVERLEQKVQLIRLALTMVTMTKSRYQEVYGKVKLWDNLIYNMLLEDDVVIPPENIQPKSSGIKGAWVKEPIAAKYRWVCSLDLTSLYPSICMMYNMSPETLIQEAVDDPMGFMERMLAGEDLTTQVRARGYVSTANGAVFDPNKQGVLPRAMKYVFDTRKKNKNLMLTTQKKKEEYLSGGGTDEAVIKNFDNQIAAYDATQGAMKVLANSGYGATANNAFRYYNRNIAEGITITGQLTIRYIIAMINKFLNHRYKTNRDYVIAADTDSAYLTLDNEPSDPNDIEKSVDELSRFIEEELQPFTTAAFEKLGKRLGAQTNLMDMKKEAIASTGIWRAKKNYILLVHEMEGVRYAKPKVKTTGVEAVRGSTPKVCREELKKCYDLMLHDKKEELLSEIKRFKAEFMSLPIEVQAQPIGVSTVDGYEGERSPPWNTQAAMHHNKLLLDKNLWRKYPRIRNGAKIKVFMLKTPNPIRGNYIGFQGTLPPEFELDKYLDVEGQFKKVFMGPVDSFCKILGWETEKRSTLAGLFG